MTAKEFTERWNVAEDWAQELIDLAMKVRNPDRHPIGSEAETERGAVAIANANSGLRFDGCFEMAKAILGNDHLTAVYRFEHLDGTQLEQIRATLDDLGVRYEMHDQWLYDRKFSTRIFPVPPGEKWLVMGNSERPAYLAFTAEGRFVRYGSSCHEPQPMTA